MLGDSDERVGICSLCRRICLMSSRVSYPCVACLGNYAKGLSRNTGDVFAFRESRQLQLLAAWRLGGYEAVWVLLDAAAEPGPW